MYFWGCGGIFNLGNSRILLRNSRIPKIKLPRNSRIFVIASKAKQSLEILNSSLGNSRIYLGNSRILLAFRLDKFSSQIL